MTTQNQHSNAAQNQTDPYSTPATYKVRVGENILTIANAEPTIRELFTEARFEPDDYYALQHLEGEPSVILGPDDNIDATLPGLEWIEPVSRVGRYLTRVDNIRHVFKHAQVTGREFLVAAGKDPEKFKLVQILTSGEGKFVDLDDIVDLGQPGIERFVTASHDEEPECVTDIRLRIVTPIGEWNTSFPKTTLVSAVITATLNKFDRLDKTQRYDLRRRGTGNSAEDESLPPEQTLKEANVRDRAVLKLHRAEDGGGQ